MAAASEQCHLGAMPPRGPCNGSGEPGGMQGSAASPAAADTVYSWGEKAPARAEMWQGGPPLPPKSLSTTEKTPRAPSPCPSWQKSDPPAFPVCSPPREAPLCFPAAAGQDPVTHMSVPCLDGDSGRGHMFCSPKPLTSGQGTKGWHWHQSHPQRPDLDPALATMATAPHPKSPGRESGSFQHPSHSAQAPAQQGPQGLLSPHPPPSLTTI